MSDIKLITYLNYISDWQSESDERIGHLISEFNAFMKLDDFDPNPVIDDVIKMIATKLHRTFDVDGQACDIMYEKQMIVADLRNLSIIIATKCSSGLNVLRYVRSFEDTNKVIIEDQKPQKMDTRVCQTILMQFIAGVQKNTGSINAANFKKYAAVARRLYNSTQIRAVYDAFDSFNRSGKTEDGKKIMTAVKKSLDELQISPKSYHLVCAKVVSTLLSAKISRESIQKIAKVTGLPEEEFGNDVIEMSEGVEKFDTANKATFNMAGTVDKVISIINHNYGSQQYDELLAQLEEIKQPYRDYFNGIRISSHKFRMVLGLN